MTSEIINILSPLQELRFNCNNFTGEYLCFIPALFPKLGALSVRHCIHLSPDLLEELQTNFPNLKVVTYSEGFTLNYVHELCWPFCLLDI
jgi:hypothetical protein